MIATLTSTDDEQIRDYLRGLHANDLAAIRDGSGHIHGDQPGSLIDVTKMPVSDRVRELAAEQLELRREGRRRVLAALADLGMSQSGTDWEITAHVDREGRLGLVNIAHGVAVTTATVIPADVIQECTIPAQQSGPLASGAAVWSVPDAGEPGRATAPDGWTQLLVDVRTSVVDGLGDTPPEPTDIVAITWGLQTAYGHRGRPGHASLAGPRGAQVPPSEWPETPGTDQMRRIASDALLTIGRRLAGMLADGDTIDWTDPHTAANSVPRWNHGGSSGAEKGVWRALPHKDGLRELLTGAVGELLSLAADGASHATLAVIHEVVHQRLVAAMNGYYNALIAGGTDADQAAHDVYMLIHGSERRLDGMISRVLDQALRDVTPAAKEALEAAHAAYLDGGPVTWDGDGWVERRVRDVDATLLDIAGVADRLHLSTATIRRYRADGRMPPPDVMVGRSPAWRADTIDRWQASRPGQGARTDLRSRAQGL